MAQSSIGLRATALFRLRCFDVVSCSWKNSDAAAAQVRDMVRYRGSSTAQMKRDFRGVTQTVWSGANGFLDQFYDCKPDNESKNPGDPGANGFKTMFDEVAQ
jgi:hypothetical protein